MKLKLILASVFMHLTVSVSAQKSELIKVASLPAKLHESSGLEITSDGMIWTIVDSNHATLFGLDSTGKMVKAVHLNNLNKGWEDLSKDEEGNFYIGDFGNNLNDRKDLKIYKIPDPAQIQESIVTAEIIHFSYPDQKIFPPPAHQLNFDMDAMVCLNDSIFLFSKNRTKPYTGYSKVYRLPNKPGTYIAELIDSIYLESGTMLETWVTAAALSPDKRILTLLTHGKLYVFHCFSGSNFFTGKKSIINLNHYSQKEGIVFRDSNTLYLSDEKTANILGGNLYIYKFDSQVFNCH